MQPYTRWVVILLCCYSCHVLRCAVQAPINAKLLFIRFRRPRKNFANTLSCNRPSAVGRCFAALLLLARAILVVFPLSRFAPRHTHTHLDKCGKFSLPYLHCARRFLINSWNSSFSAHNCPNSFRRHRRRPFRLLSSRFHLLACSALWQSTTNACHGWICQSITLNAVVCEK